MKYVHYAVIAALLGGIVMLVNGIETALAQTARTAQVNLVYGVQPSYAVSGAVSGACGTLEWLLPIVVIVVIAVAMLACYCKHAKTAR